MTRKVDEFTAFVEARGWKYVEQWVPAGSFVDDDGELIEWESYTRHIIHRDEPFGADACLHQELELADDFLDLSEQVWQLYVTLGDMEFEKLRERETKKHQEVQA